MLSAQTYDQGQKAETQVRDFKEKFNAEFELYRATLFKEKSDELKLQKKELQKQYDNFDINEFSTYLQTELKTQFNIEAISVTNTDRLITISFTEQDGTATEISFFRTDELNKALRA